MSDQIAIHTYEDTWPSQYQAESEKLSAAFNIKALELAHMGSTAVPGLSAKPTIDILIGIPVPIDGETVSTANDMGYAFIRYNEPWWAFFRKGPDRAFHLHMIDLSTPDGRHHWQRQLFFRNALRASQKLCRAYEELKFSLVQQFADDRRAYEAGKTEFVLQVLKSMPNSLNQ